MNLTLVFFLLLFPVLISSREPYIILNYNGSDYNIPVTVKNGTEYVSCTSLLKVFNATLYYNPVSKKAELKFTDKVIKFTAMSKFVITTSRTGENQSIYQIPVGALPGNEDVLIPIHYCLEPFNKIVKNKISLSKVIKDETISSQKDAKELNESRSSNTSGYDITNILIDIKANGTLVRILSSQKIKLYSHSITNNVLLLNIVGISINPKIIIPGLPKGLVRKIEIKNYNKNSQIEFYLEKDYSNVEVFGNDSGKDLMITIHNKLLGDFDKIKERWNFDAVVIDAGHGGQDPGAIGIGGVKEKDINLAIALQLGELIKEELPDIKVIYTRSSDKFIELYKRGKIANENNGKLFISIHCNSTPQKPTSRSGYEIYLLRPGRTSEAIAIAERENSVIHYEDNPERYKELTDENFILVTMAHSSYLRFSETFSEILNKNFTELSSLKSNGIKQAGFYVLVGASMPSVLIETGFISNKEDAEYLASKKGQTHISKSIFNAVKEFQNQYSLN